MTPTTTARLDEAAAHLDAAAALADRDDITSGYALAGQIRLTRAGLQAAPSSQETIPGPDTVSGRLQAAVTVLDSIAPLDGPPDLAAWTWQISELARLVHAAGGGPR